MLYRILRSLIRCALFAMLITQLCQAQKLTTNHITFRFVQENGKKYDLVGWLEHNVPSPLRAECKPTFDFFYFKVNGLGKIDTLFHDGNLREVVTERIIKNIYSTQGHWKIPPGMKPKDTRLFVFPYFDFGGAFYGDSSCPEADKLFQKTVMDLASQVGKLSFVTKGAATVLLRATQRGGGYIEM